MDYKLIFLIRDFPLLFFIYEMMLYGPCLCIVIALLQVNKSLCVLLRLDGEMDGRMEMKSRVIQQLGVK